MDYLERYLAQISRHLNKNDRQDTINELRSLLLENFEANDDSSLSEDEKMITVIKAFGSPIDVAGNYNTQEPLISKEYTPLFYLIMKIVSFTIPGSLLIANTIEYLNNATETSMMGLLLDTAYYIPDILQTVAVALALLFLAFILLSRYVKPSNELYSKTFDPHMLPPIPKGVMKVSIVEQVIGIIGSCVFLYLFNLQPGLIAIYYDNVREPLLNPSFEEILPLINISVFISLALYIFYLYNRKKTVASCTIEFAVGILSAVIMFLLANRDIFNPVIIGGFGIDVIPKLLTIGLYIGGVAAIIGHTVGYIKVLFRHEEESA